MKKVSLAEVRVAAARVAERSDSVRIRRERLSSYADEVARGAPVEPALDPRCHYLGEGDDTVAFILTLDAVNFGSGWFPWLVEGPGGGGYFTIASGLTGRFARLGPLSARELSRIDAAACAEIFGQTEAPEELGELLELFAGAWRQLGRHLLHRFGGRFTALVQEARGSAERLVGLLAEMPAFADVATYGLERLPVPLYKRAQLAAADLHLAFRGEGPGRFRDLERLTVFADNQVPHVLRLDGVLDYDDELARRIDAGEELAAGSRHEVEIRALTVHAVELLAAEIAALGTALPPWILDQLLWHRALEPRYAVRPPHRTRTVFY